MTDGPEMSRAALVGGFLKEAGWGEAARYAVAADWSTRRYERLHLMGATRILMDAPEPWTAQAGAFAAVAAILRSVGLSAPDVFALDAENGLLISEDFGDALFARLLDGGEAPEPLYALATDALIHLHRAFEPAMAAGLPAWDIGRFTAQVDLFGRHFVPAATGRVPDAAAMEALDAAWRAVLPAGFRVPDSLLLRDYFPGNLMWLGEREGVRRCGILDFQDAGVGPVAYDLMSLLEDARRDVAPDLKAAMIARYLTAFPGLDVDAFATSFAVLGAARHARILGRIAELAAEGRRGMLAYLPRVWDQFAERLADPALLPLEEWVLANLPEDGGPMGGVIARIVGDSAP